MTQEFKIARIAHISSSDHCHGKRNLCFCVLAILIAAATTAPMSAILPSRIISRSANLPYASGLDDIYPVRSISDLAPAIRIS